MALNSQDIEQLIAADAIEVVPDPDPALAVQVHHILSPEHNDSVPGDPERGDLIVGDSAGRWNRLPLGEAGEVLKGGTSDPGWGVLLHSELGGVTPDQHHAKVHGADHAIGGADPFIPSDLFGNMVFVDSVNGNDSTGARGLHNKPFLTIAAALAAAQSGDAVQVLPGTYNLAAGITLPTGVTLKGVAVNAVLIQMLAVANPTTLVTMGENTRIEDVNLRLTSLSNFALVGIKFGGTTSATARVRSVSLVVDNTGAGAATAALTGVSVQSTGTPDRTTNAIRASTITVTADAAASSTQRGVLLDTSACTFSMRDVNVLVNGGTGSRIGLECNFAGATLSTLSGTVSGVTADISQTLGTLELGAVALVNNTTNGFSFTQLLPISNTQATATADTTTTSAVDVLVTGMTLTPIAGTYLVWFDSGMEISGAGTISVSIYFGGVQVADSVRTLRPGAAAPTSATSIAKVTVNGSQAIEARWNVTAGTGTAHQRNLTVMRVS